MPNILRQPMGRQKVDFSKVNHDYNYPKGLDLDPKSDLHKDLLDKIMTYAHESAAHISNRFDSWNEIDRTLTAYIEHDDDEKEVTYNDPRKPVSIVFPNSYAIMETILAYLIAAFYQDPVFQYEGNGPEDVIGAALMELTIARACEKNKIILALHTMFRDSLSYGIGPVAPVWAREFGKYVTVEDESYGFAGLRSRKKKRVHEGLLFEGNDLLNIDPYRCLPDPNIAIHNLQKGEFFGWVESTNYHDLLSTEKNNKDYFNVKYLDSVHNKMTSIYGEDKSDRNAKWINRRTNRYHTEPGVGQKLRSGSMSTKPCDVVHMYVKLIPKEWEIGSSEYPEKWLFSIGADSVIVRAKPLGLNHNKFPVAIAAPDFDGYSATPISRLEMLYGLQHVLDWLFNMHVQNVRKTINDMLIYDPYLINSRDINSTEAGKRIRIRRPGWGRPDLAKGAVNQLQVADVTRQHIADSSWIVQWQQKIGASSDQAMGMLRQGGPERLTKSEFQGTQFGEFSRLGRIAKVIGAQSMQDIGYMFASDMQQLMSEEQYVKVVGRWQSVLLKEYGVNDLRENRGRISVSPYDLLVRYDLKVRDGSVPGSNFSDVWVKLFDIIAKTPELYQEFDITRIFMHIARSAGAKNVQEFVRTKVVPDEEVANQAQKGNLVPINQVA